MRPLAERVACTVGGGKRHRSPELGAHVAMLIEGNEVQGKGFIRRNHRGAEHAQHVDVRFRSNPNARGAAGKCAIRPAAVAVYGKYVAPQCRRIVDLTAGAALTPVAHPQGKAVARREHPVRYDHLGKARSVGLVERVYDQAQLRRRICFQRDVVTRRRVIVLHAVREQEAVALEEEAAAGPDGIADSDRELPGADSARRQGERQATVYQAVNTVESNVAPVRLSAGMGVNLDRYTLGG